MYLIASNCLYYKVFIIGDLILAKENKDIKNNLQSIKSAMEPSEDSSSSSVLLEEMKFPVVLLSSLPFMGWQAGISILF